MAKWLVQRQSQRCQIHYSMIKRAGNDNVLTPEQKRRLSIIEKTCTGSQAVH